MKDDRQDRIKYPAPHWAVAEIKELRAQLAELRKDYDDIRIALIEEREAFLSQCAAAELELRNLRQAALQAHDDTARIDYLDMPWVKVSVFGHPAWFSEKSYEPLTLRQWIDGRMAEMCGNVDPLNPANACRRESGHNGLHEPALTAAIPKTEPLAAAPAEEEQPKDGRCDFEVYMNGEVVDVQHMSAVEAEERVNEMRATMPGFKVDWHYVAGRAVFKRLPLAAPAEEAET